MRASFHLAALAFLFGRAPPPLNTSDVHSGHHCLLCFPPDLLASSLANVCSELVLLRLSSVTTLQKVAMSRNSASSDMEPKKDLSRGPTTTILGPSKMTPSLLDNMVRRGIVSVDDVRPPPRGETIARPHNDEVVVFRDLFTAGLRFLLDPVIVDIFCLFGVYLH